MLRLLPLLFALVLFVATAVAAEAPSAKKPADVRVIIDISGSMKLNDPDNLRRPALELLVRLFPEGARAGVWTFGQWVNMLVPHGPVDQAWREQALAAAADINSVALYTNIPEALEKAAKNLDKVDANYDTHLILLTDGMVDISKSSEENAAARARIIDEILPKLRAVGYTIHTVALSKNADIELMERLAVESNGLTAVAESAEDLTEVFLQAFDAAAPAEQLPLEGNSFVVDSSIEEFTALIFRQPGSEPAVLVSPDNKSASFKDHGDDVRWFQHDNYDLITVKKPFEGEWRLQADLAPNSRVTIVSNLGMVVSRLATSMFAGEQSELSVLFQEQGKTIQSPELLKLVDLSISVQRRDDDKQWQLSLSDANSVPANGLFTGELEMLAEGGVYDIVVRADGKSFQRQQSQTIAVRETFDISQSSSEDSPPNHSVRLFARNPQLDTEGSNVLARVKRPDGSSALKAVKVVEERSWELELKGIEQSGVYEVTFEATGQYKSGGRFDFSSETATIEHRVDGSLPQPKPLQPAEVEPVVEAASDPMQPAVSEAMAEAGAEPEASGEPAAETEQQGIADWLLYGGIALGNILALGLGYMAYRMVMGAGKSDILEQDDEVEVSDDALEEAVEAAQSTGVAEPEPEFEADDGMEAVDIAPADDGMDDLDTEMLDVDDGQGDEAVSADEIDDIFDLPDDAIDIDDGK